MFFLLQEMKKSPSKTSLKKDTKDRKKSPGVSTSISGI